MTSEPPPGDRWASSSWGVTASSHKLPQDKIVHRLSCVVGGLSLLLIALVAVAWQHNGSSLNPIAEAAEKTRRQPGSRSVIHARVSYESDPGSSFTMRGRGIYNAQTHRSRVTLTVEAPQPISAVKMSAVGDGRIVYMRSPLFSKSLPPGQSWMAVDPWLGGGAQAPLPGSGDTQGQLELLEGASGEVERLGEEDVRGVPTSRYRGTIDLGEHANALREEGKPRAARHLAKLAELAPSRATAEAWVDADGLLRRMRIVMSLPEESGQPAAEMDMRIEFFDFGIAPGIALPKQSQVFDATPLVRPDLDLLTGDSLGEPRDPPGAALSAAAFRKRASKVCKEIKRQIDRVERHTAPQLRALEELNRDSSKEQVARALRAYAHKATELFFPLFDRYLDRLGRLNPPPGLRDRYANLLRIGAIEFEVFKAMTRATELVDLPLVKRLGKRFDRLSDRSDKLAERLGLKSCTNDDDESDTSAATSGSA